MSNNYSVYSEFDIEKHIATYTNYFEVIMMPSGKIEYAVPSHQEKLIGVLMSKWNCTRDEAANRCPRSMWFDFMTWLLQESGCVALWSDGYTGNPNHIQQAVIDKLIYNRLTKKYYSVLGEVIYDSRRILTGT